MLKKALHGLFQVVVLSEGHQLYFGDPRQAVHWFSGTLNYSFHPDKDGAVSDWLMDMVRWKPSSAHLLEDPIMNTAGETSQWT